MLESCSRVRFRHPVRALFAFLTLLASIFLLPAVTGRAQSVSPTPGVSVHLTPAAVLSGSQCKVGQPVEFHVVVDVRDASGALLIPAGCRVQGYVVEAQGPRGFGEPGALRIACDFVELPDHRHVPLRFDMAASGNNDRFEAEFVALPITGVVTTVVSIGSAILAYGDGSSVVGIPMLLLLPAYVAVKVYHFIGSLYRGTDAVIRPGDSFAGIVRFPAAEPAQLADPDIPKPEPKP